ncbi:MAG: response regulator [Clostridia bacterium]|nr:response regulator [Clostridia bacterium]
MNNRKKRITVIAVIGGIFLALVLVLGTMIMGQQARNDTEKAVRNVSLLYLDELAGRREQVIADNLKDKITVIQTALDLMTEDDLSSVEHLQNYQKKIRSMLKLERFAFVEETGMIFTASGIQGDIDQYPVDFRNLSGPEIFIRNLTIPDKKVIIAVPVQLTLENRKLCACFMEIDMKEMLSGVAMDIQESGATFCNIYTSDGIALSNTVLGGLAVEDNLLEAMRQANFEDGYTYEKFRDEFTGGKRGTVSFVYNGIRETLSYVPVEGTSWLLTYLIRESVISSQISTISEGIIGRSVLQSVIIVSVLVIMFAFIIRQNRINARLVLDKEKADTENRIKREEMEQRLHLQEEILEQRKQQEEQTRMITALASDYWSVYYLDLDKNEGVCYQKHEDVDNGFQVGDRFPYMESVTAYANANITEEYRQEFLEFIRPENIRTMLGEQRVIAFRYLVSRHDRQTWEEVRFASVDRKDLPVHAVGACFVNVDIETRKTMVQNQTLKDALSAAEMANKAKTAFLSSMSHEIRTPMNAIIGLDNIILHDPNTPEQTRANMRKIDDSAHHLLKLINDILNMSRIESGRMTIKHEEFSFRKMLEQVNTMIGGQCRDKGLNYDCQIKGKTDEYYIGDDMKLRQVLINILGNAVKFTPEGGTVSLIIEETVRMDDKATLLFTISDTGIGMSKEYLPHLFDAFSQEDSSTTNKYGSSGLGMPITKNIVELMNGHIEVESEKGAGTTFRVTVTLGQSSRVAGSEETLIHPDEMNVLVIDDDQIACEHADLVLGQVGISCETVTNGRDALEMIRLRHARREDYNLVLVDWKMPEMDGVETTRQIRSLVGNDTPIIILTSYSWEDVEQEAREAGVDSFASKPLFADTVLDEFQAAFKRKNAALIQKTVDLKGRRVLLAEDVAVNAEIMMMVLSMREMQVEHAVNGRVAVEMFDQAEPGYYDAVLMDMRMPEMDGLEATRRIRSLDRPDAKTIPIIALTANAFDEDVQRSMQAGLNAHLSKPVEPQALFETLESLIRS